MNDVGMSAGWLAGWHAGCKYGVQSTEYRVDGMKYGVGMIGQRESERWN